MTQKTLIGGVISSGVCLLIAGSLTAYAQDEDAIGKGLFAGAGLTYVSPKVDGMDSVEDAIGFKGTVGYKVDENLSLGVDFLYIPSIENDQKATSESSRYYYYAEIPVTEISAMGFIPFAKYSFVQAQDSLKGIVPYITVGLGYMDFEAEESASLPSDYSSRYWDYEYSYEGIDSVSGFCFKAGVGGEYYINPNMSLGADLEYLVGTGDIDGYDHISVGINFAYHFF